MPGLPSLLAGPLQRRIQTLNEIYEVHEAYGALRLDLSADPADLLP